MVEVKEFERVLLKDGREGTVVEIYGDQEVFDIDIGSSPSDWDTITVKREEIVRVLKTPTDT